MTALSDTRLELATARGPVAVLRVDGTGDPVVLCPGVIGSKEDFAALLPLLGIEHLPVEAR